MTNPSIGGLSPNRYLEKTSFTEDLLKPLAKKVGIVGSITLFLLGLVLLPLTLILGITLYTRFLVDKKWNEDHDFQKDHRIVGSSGSNFKLAKKAMKSK